MNPKAVSQVHMVWLGYVVTTVATLYHVVFHICSIVIHLFIQLQHILGLAL